MKGFFFIKKITENDVSNQKMFIKNITLTKQREKKREERRADKGRGGEKGYKLIS